MRVAVAGTDATWRYLAGAITRKAWLRARRSGDAAEGAPTVVFREIDSAAVASFAELLGEIAADLWLDGKLDLD